MEPLLTWLIQAAVGPALVGLPVTWAVTDLAGAARRWFRRLRRSDGLSRIVRAAVGSDVNLSDAEFAAVRRLLEQESTWVEVGRGTVEDLAGLIASCLPGRPDEGSLAAGRAIARGLLEFAVRDLEPEWFQQVVFARLDRMQADQASALDQAMLSVHADLTALLAYQDAADADRFARVMGQLARMLDRLPPGPADRGEVAVYLTTLLGWLNTDPWPQDTRFAGPRLTPAAIERRLRIASDRGASRQDLGADDLARQCSRLVVLGGPGSGKTWLAKRTARLCAESSLNALAAGAELDEVELPLYTTCTRLSAAPPGDGIRRAVVASALGQLPDLGGSRVTDALQALFEERDTPTLLVADSLDEARGADDRIRQADTLPPAWRIVLTSRPASWNRQLAISDDGPSRQVGVLQPLRYPSDVEPFIAGWFSGRPAWAADLAAQLRNRPALQQAATVPLILAFYCIVGGDQPLPGRRADLYAKVIRRMLTGRWRGGGDQDPDPDACLETLRDWAWSAAARNPVSGVGVWEDEFPTPRVRQSKDDRDALDHVAVPLGPADADTGLTQRRFVHRSIREHQVAEHVALRMPAEVAAGELLNHLWYDPDWEHAGPAALAMHPQRDQVLDELICRVTGGCQLRADLGAVDGCWEIRRFLARVALESGEDTWSPKASQMIGQARQDLATSRPEHIDQVVANEWPTSNGLITESLIGLLARETDPERARALADAVAGLDPAPEDLARARESLLGLLARETDPERARALADAVAGLDPAPEDLARAREALLGMLASTTISWSARALADAVAGLDPAPEDLARTREALLGLLHAGGFSHEGAAELAEAVARLAVTEEDRALAREALLWPLAHEIDPEKARELAEEVARLTVTEEDRARTREALLRLLARETHDPRWARGLAEAVARLTVTEEDRARTRKALLGLLADETDPKRTRALAEAVAGLDPAAEDLARTREALLGLLASTDSPWSARELADAVAGLDPAAEDRARAREALLGLLADETDPQGARELAEALGQLAVTEEDQARTREALLVQLGLLAGETGAQELAEEVARLAVTEEDRARAREALLGLLADETDPQGARGLAEAVAGLDPAAEDLARAREALLGLLARETDPWGARWLAEAVAGLDPAAEDLARAREALLGLLPGETDPWGARWLAEAVAGLDPAAEDRARARTALLGLLASTDNPWWARELADAVAGLDPAAEDLARAREALLRLLAHETRLMAVHDLAWLMAVHDLAWAVAGLDPAPEDRARARAALLGLLADETDPREVRTLAELVARLAVTEDDRALVREALLRPLAGETDPKRALELAEAVAGLDPTAEDLARAREALLGLLLARETHDPSWAGALAEAVAGLDPAAEDLARAREALVRLLSHETDPERARWLAEAVAGLSPTVADLGGWDSWPFPPPAALLAAARHNSGLLAWLAALGTPSDA